MLTSNPPKTTQGSPAEPWTHVDAKPALPDGRASLGSKHGPSLSVNAKLAYHFWWGAPRHLPPNKAREADAVGPRVQAEASQPLHLLVH